MHAFVAESLSLTLKEVSLQMDDDAERLRIYALLTCVITVVFDIFLGAAAFGKYSCFSSDIEYC